MSLRIIPAPKHAVQISTTNGAPSVRSIPDPMRNGLQSVSAEVNGKHPLEARLKNWDETQQALKMESLMRVYGAQEPIRRGMEMKISGSDWRPAQLGGPSNFHLDILKGKDTTIEWEDVYKGTDNTEELPGFHAEMESKLKMNW
ncbi:uncharacterized protein LAJ45_03775 [Morchella importuna]|nr:uncharacterized protein LAJ45_03775 [Morchella importuna]KAH8152348.1 hypothetical protein LAJ45_03775 [Morchella importuna]